jgi:hypothetical protein
MKPRPPGFWLEEVVVKASRRIAIAVGISELYERLASVMMLRVTTIADGPDYTT